MKSQKKNIGSILNKWGSGWEKQMYEAPFNML